MVLTPAQRARYARHLLLPEIGELGQARLLASTVQLAGDQAVQVVARSYLERAGVSVEEHAGTPLKVLSQARLEALAGAPFLLEAARALAGAFTAVETIKSVVAIGQPSELPQTFSLASEDA